MSEDDKFYRDLVYKMMGFGVAVLLIYMGWMVGTEDKEKFIRPWTGDDLLTVKAEEIALRYDEKKEGVYLNKLDEIRCALSMRRDRGWSLVGFFIGSLVWMGTIWWAYSNIQDCNQKTVPKKQLVFIYCILIMIPQGLAVYLIFKDTSFYV